MDQVQFNEDDFEMVNSNGHRIDNDTDDPAELNFDEVPLSADQEAKLNEIDCVLELYERTNDPLSFLKKWRNLAISEHGLVSDRVRKKIWPLLLEIDPRTYQDTVPDLRSFEHHKEFNQVVLDVNRSLKRFPPGIPYHKRIELQDDLTRLIMRIITKHPQLHYFQGYHDVAITFLLVVGDSLAFAIMEKLSLTHFVECMEPTLDKTAKRLEYVLPIIHFVNSDLARFLKQAEVGIMFALPWYITWFGHSLNQYRDVVRLYDYFLATPQLSSLYVCAALVHYRSNEIFQTDCDYALVHQLLQRIPDRLPLEDILRLATKLFKEYPLATVEADLNAKRFRSGRQPFVFSCPLSSIYQQIESGLLPHPTRNIRYTLFLATASFAFGWYAFFHRNDTFF